MIPADLKKGIAEDEASLAKFRRDLAEIERGGRVQNLSHEGAEQAILGLEATIRNKRKLLKAGKNPHPFWHLDKPRGIGVVALGAMQLTPKERMALAEARQSGSVRTGHIYSKRTLASLTDKGYLRLKFKGYEFDTYEPIS